VVFYLLLIIFLKEVTMNIVNLLDSDVFYFARFGVLKAVFVKNQVLRSVTP